MSYIVYVLILSAQLIPSHSLNSFLPRGGHYLSAVEQAAAIQELILRSAYDPHDLPYDPRRLDSSEFIKQQVGGVRSELTDAERDAAQAVFKYGTVALAQYEPLRSSSRTGLFQSGALAVLRLSLMRCDRPESELPQAAGPAPALEGESRVIPQGDTSANSSELPALGAGYTPGFIPGLSIQFLVDRSPSIALVAMRRDWAAPLDQSGKLDRNFFALPLTTCDAFRELNFEAFELDCESNQDFEKVWDWFKKMKRIVADSFLKIPKKYRGFIPQKASNLQALKKMAEILRDGSRVEGEPSLLDEILFVSDLNSSDLGKKSFPMDFRQQLAKIKEGKIIFKVFGHSRGEPPGMDWLGNLILLSPFIASAFGDLDLFQNLNEASDDELPEVAQF